MDFSFFSLDGPRIGRSFNVCMPIPPRRNGGFCLRRFAMCADAPRPKGNFAKGLRGRQNFVSQTQALRTNEAVPATDRNVALRNQLSKLEREKK